MCLDISSFKISWQLCFQYVREQVAPPPLTCEPGLRSAQILILCHLTPSSQDVSVSPRAPGRRAPGRTPSCERM